jgi:hypothetical protein
LGIEFRVGTERDHEMMHVPPRLPNPHP